MRLQCWQAVGSKREDGGLPVLEGSLCFLPSPSPSPSVFLQEKGELGSKQVVTSGRSAGGLRRLCLHQLGC